MATYVNSVPEQASRLPDTKHSYRGSKLHGSAHCSWSVTRPFCTGWSVSGLSDEDMGHGFFVPVIAGYIVWQRRDELSRLKPEPNHWGLVLILWGAAAVDAGHAGRRDVSGPYFVPDLAGRRDLVPGRLRILKALSFPLVLLLFMIPMPAIIYARITLPLQLFASGVAEIILGLLGIPVYFATAMCWSWPARS